MKDIFSVIGEIAADDAKNAPAVAPVQLTDNKAQYSPEPKDVKTNTDPEPTPGDTDPEPTPGDNDPEPTPAE